MSDKHIRRLERNWKESGAVEDESALIRARIHGDVITTYDVELAAKLGYEAARLALDIAPDEVPSFSVNDLEGKYLIRAMIPVIRTMVEEIDLPRLTKRLPFIDKMVEKPHRWIGCVPEDIEVFGPGFQSEQDYNDEEPELSDLGPDPYLDMLPDDDAPHFVDSSPDYYEDIVQKGSEEALACLNFYYWLQDFEDQAILNYQNLLGLVYDLTHVEKQPCKLHKYLLGNEELYIASIAKEMTPWLMGYSDPVRERQ